ncbi:MAG: hypothetical protein EXQ94_08360 [Alphaproteobacteria bacterium]|nr:hypothetical protein [Alphaproteobacteria bacterium]
MDALDRFADLDRFPVHDLDGPRGRALLADCQTGLATQGAANLPAFLSTESVASLAAEARALETLAYAKNTRRNAYFTPDDPSLPQDHPLRRFFPIVISQVAGDVLPPASHLAQLYASDLLKEFVRRALGLPRLFRRADVFQNVNLVFIPPGGVQPWHYDQNQFTITLLLQPPGEGGDFEFVPNLRTATEPSYDGVARLFRGEHPGVVRLPRPAGTLTLFRGEHAMHRVSPVAGTRPRITAILTYDEEPGQWATDAENTMIYGPRVRDIMAARRATER